MSDSQADTDRRRFLKGTGVAAVSAGLAGCSGGDGTETDEETPTPTPTDDQTPTEASGSDINEGGVFRFGMTQPVDSMNLLATNTAYAALVHDLIWEYGTAVDPVEFGIRPNVFTEWTAEELDETGEDDNPNVMVRFNVRDGLTFNDGSELSVSDVVFSYRFVTEANPGAFATAVSPIILDSIQESDSEDWDVEFEMEQAIGTYASTQLGGIPILPESQWGDVDPGEFQQFNPMETDFGGPIGLGPGVVTRYEPDTATEISFAEREGEYTLSELDWREEVNGIIPGGPFVDAVRFLIYGSASAQDQALLNDEIDTVYSGVQASQTEAVEDSETLEFVQGFDTGYGHYSFNLRSTPFDDITFRQVFGFAFDDTLWNRRLNQGNTQEGDFIMPPGYTAVRPESSAEDAQVLTDPRSQAFTFRQNNPGVPDVEGIRSFLENGEAITGEGGTYLGQEYPGTFTDVTANQTSSKYDYTFGEPQSDVIASNPNADAEIRVDGETITSLNDGEPLTMYVYPAENAPQTANMVENYIDALQQIGIPVTREVQSFNTMIDSVYAQEDFDVFPMGWVNLSPFATATLYGLFHSDNADDRSEGNNDALLNNPMGYGLFDDAGADDLIDAARSELEAETRNQLARQAVEQIYLDFPTMVESYDVIQWPVNTSRWKGLVGNIPGPGTTYIGTQFKQVNLREAE